jgi:hypothetical protein
MLPIHDFFAACTGNWKIERTYHYPLQGEVERSFTESTVNALTAEEKDQISSVFLPAKSVAGNDAIANSPGFSIGFNTVSETGERVSMQLKALFVPDSYIIDPSLLVVDSQAPALPLTAQIPDTEEVIRGIYLRDEGYSESGAITSRFTYLPSRQTLEMTTYYSRTVAVDQMRFIAPDLRIRTIVTYQRPPAGELPTLINLIGFGMEKKINN